MKRVSLVQIGLGTVGGVLLEQVVQGHDRWCEELGLDIRVAAIAGRDGALVADDPAEGLRVADIHARVSQRRTGGADDRLATRVPAETALQQSIASGPTILIDAATGSATASVAADALTGGAGVVLSNKAPLSLPQDDPISRILWEGARHEQLRYEATCGAGLPVISTLRGLLDSGDEVIEVTGALSGTFGTIFSLVTEGATFSEAVRLAKAKGYTEPDPRDDLSGLDVARKALILARTVGITIDLEDMLIQSLVPAALTECSVADFLELIASEDAEIATLAAQAKADGASLKYVARVTPGADEVASVGVSEIPTSTMLGALQGPESIVSFRTRRYDAYPLVVAGAGAGAEVTAAGMVTDMLTLAQRLG